MNGLFEILQNREWMIRPSFVHGIRKVFEQNLNGHVMLGQQEKHLGYAAVMKDGGSRPDFKEYLISDSGEVVPSCFINEMNAPFVNVLNVQGPITRNGGACSYGSKQLRDMLFMAADSDFCCGHIFYINTPGGSAWAKNDFEQAIEYAHEKNQPVIAFIDGLCASAGMYLAALCDERYYMHPKDEVGCIGVMAAFYTMKDGEKNEYSGETYHEIYDPESFDKNRDFRDIANDGNDKQLVEDLKKLGNEFRSDVKKACPDATDEHLRGKVFAAEEVKGILVDDRMSFNEVIERVFALHSGAAMPIERKVVSDVPVDTDEDKDDNTGDENEEKPEKPQDAPNDNPQDEPDGNPDDTPDGESQDNPDEKPEETKTNQDMGKNEILAAACGVEEIVVTEEGTHLAPSLIDRLTNRLEADKAEKESLEQQVKDLQQQVAKAESDSQQAIAAAKEDAKAVSDAAVQAAVADKETAVKEANDAKAAVERTLEETKEALEKAEQTAKDLAARVEELTVKPQRQETGSPASNGTDMEETFVCGMPVYDPHKSPMENHRIFEDYEKKMKAFI